MNIRILAFGAAKEMVGSSAITVAAEPGITAAALVDKLRFSYPALSKLSSFALAVNGSYAEKQTTINPGDEVAIIPPVSGG